MSTSGCSSNVNVYSHSFVSEREFYLWMQLCEICSDVFLLFSRNTTGKKNLPPKIYLRAELKSIQKRELLRVLSGGRCQ